MWQQIAFSMYLFLEIKKNNYSGISVIQLAFVNNVKIQGQFRGCESGLMGVPCMTE